MKRSRFGIINDILIITEKGKTKTHIMYGVNLSHNQLRESLRLLQVNNLLTLDKNNEKSCYKTTEKGFGFLEKYGEIQNILSDDKNGKSKLTEKT